ncbi:hypothetical protein BHE74_00005869 [Ensete ventricosum]|nr:hypothetical protein BHE74_00005869 [Ensete ventricosum]
MVFRFGFGRRDSFITHRAFCDALAEESAKTVAKPPAEDGKAAATQDGAAVAAGQDATVATAETAPAAVMAAALPPQQVTPLDRQGSRPASLRSPAVVSAHVCDRAAAEGSSDGIRGDRLVLPQRLRPRCSSLGAAARGSPG